MSKSVSPRGKDPAQQPVHHGGAAQRYQSRKFEYSALIVAGLAFIASAASAGFSGWQAWIARDTEIVSNRAVVISNTIRFISYDEPKEDRRWQMSVVLENVGNTPTKNLRFADQMGLCVLQPPDSIGNVFPWEHPPSTNKHALIGPKSDINGRTIEGHEVNIVDCLEAIDSFGLIKYQDIFGYPHLTEFCTYIYSIESFKTYPAGQSIRAPAFPCPHHNCTDEECGNDWKQRATE
jgi:hypothetical protein